MPKRRRPTAAFSPTEEPAQTGMRVDKWLFCARLTKTRAEAARLVESGAVRINRVKVKKPATPVRAGDVITLVRHAHVRVVRILALTDRRVSPRLAASLREEL